MAVRTYTFFVLPVFRQARPDFLRELNDLLINDYNYPYVMMMMIIIVIIII